MTVLVGDEVQPQLKTLLPLNATPWELAISAENASRRPIPFWLLGRLWNPDTCPEAALPYLANALSVDLWFDDWTIERKRLAVKKAFALTRLKGRVEGIRQHLPFVDAALKRAETPPCKVFAMPAMTDAERNAYLARFPQLRVYPYVQTQTWAGANFTNRTRLGKAFMGASYFVNLRAMLRYTRTAVYIDKGVTTQAMVATTRDRTVQDEIRIPTRRHQKSFAPGFLERLFPGGADDAPLIFKVYRDGPFAPTISKGVPITVTEQTIRVEPETVHQLHIASRGSVFPAKKVKYADRAKCFVGSGFVPPSVAWRNFFERWWIYDPTRIPDARKSSTFAGYVRLGMTKFTAIYHVEVKAKWHKCEAHSFAWGFLRAPDKTAWRRSMQAVRVSSAGRDLPLVDTKAHRVVRTSDRMKVGTVKVGQLIGV